jgi:hypothetical protein
MITASDFQYISERKLDQATEICQHCNRRIRRVINLVSGDGGSHFVGPECAIKLLDVTKGNLEHLANIHAEVAKLLLIIKKSGAEPEITAYREGFYNEGFILKVGDWRCNYPARMAEHIYPILSKSL